MKRPGTHFALETVQMIRPFKSANELALQWFTAFVAATYLAAPLSIAPTARSAHDPGVNFHEAVDCYPSSEDPEIDQTTRVADCSYLALQLGASVADDRGLVAFHVLVGCCTFFVDRVADPS